MQAINKDKDKVIIKIIPDSLHHLLHLYLLLCLLLLLLAHHHQELIELNGVELLVFTNSLHHGQQSLFYH